MRIQKLGRVTTRKIWGGRDGEMQREEIFDSLLSQDGGLSAQHSVVEKRLSTSVGTAPDDDKYAGKFR